MKEKQNRGTEKIKAQMELFLKELKSGNTVDIITDNLQDNYKAVITLEEDYLNDPSMSDLVDGYFNVIGKVTRVIPDDNNSISLVRKTALDMLPQNMVSEMLSVFASLGDNEGFRIPDIWLDVKGPVIQVIPIAIFA